MAPKVKWNIGAFQQIRRLPGVAGDVDARARRIAAAAGEGFVSEPSEGKTRHRANIYGETYESMTDAGHARLLRALDAGR